MSKRQLEKIADQLRLLSWAQGGIVTSTAGFNFKLNYPITTLVIFQWLLLQLIATIMDKRS